MANNDLFVSFGADTGGLEAAMAVAKAEVADLTREINKLGREMQATGAAGDSALGQHLRAVGVELAEAKERAKGFKEELKGEGGEAEGGFLAGIKENLEGALAPLASLRDGLGEIVELVAVAFAAEKLIELVKQMGELGEATERTSKILGITTEQVGELNYVAALTGTSTENLAQMMGRFEAGLSGAEKGTGRVAAGLRALGLSARELKEMNPSQQLREIAEATAKVGDGAAKAAALNDLGRGFVEWIPLLDEGAEGFDELGAKARAAGVALSPELTAKLVEMQHGMVGLKENIQGATISGFTPFIGVVNSAVGGMSGLASAFNDSATHGGLVKQMLDALADGFRIVESLVNDLVASLKTLAAVATYSITVAVEKVYLLGSAIGGVVDDLAHLDLSFTHTAAAAHQGAQSAADAWNDMRKTIAAAMDENDAAARKIWKDSPLAAKMGSILGFHQTDPRTGEGAGVPTGGADSSFKPPPPMPEEQQKGKADNSAFKAAQEEAAAEIKLWADAATQRESILDGELKRHQITTEQWLTGTKDALADELQDTVATYQAEIRAGNLKGQQLKAVSDKIAEAEAANATKVIKAEQKAADEMTASWKSAGDTVAGILDSQVNGLLKGTETIGQAFKNMAAGIVEDLAKVTIKILAEAVAMEALSIASGGTLGGFGAGGIGSFLAGALHFATGTPYVQNTGLAVIHQGEMITPAHMNPNNPGASGGGSGGGTGGGAAGGVTHNHYWSVQASNPRDFARQVASIWNSNPSLRPTY